MSQMAASLSRMVGLIRTAHLNKASLLPVTTRFSLSHQRCFKKSAFGHSICNVAISEFSKYEGTKLLSVPKHVSLSQSLFHTSPRRNIPPLLLVVLKPLAKAASIVTGRTVRKWWKALPDDHKSYWWGRFAEKRLFVFAGASVLCFGGLVHYFTHVKETPVTHRSRYLAFTNSQFKELAEFEYAMQLENVKGKILSPEHPVYKQVTNVVQKIVNSNQDLDYMKQQTWSILVIDSDEANAFVLPTGHIFVMSGLLKIVENDSQLAVVLGHEMAHGLLSHAAEQVSFAAVIDVFIIVIMAAIWAFMPTDGIAIVTQWFYQKVVQIMLHLPYNRKLEEEADYVGLLMMAKACYDVRESSTFWQKMALRTLLYEDKNSETTGEIPEWLSTHPTSENRAQLLDNAIPTAIDLRKSCDCSKLPDRDPREILVRFQQLLEEKKAYDQVSSKESKQPIVLSVVPNVNPSSAIAS